MANAPGKSTSLLDSIRTGARNLARRFHREVVERGNPRVITEGLSGPAMLDKFTLTPLIARHRILNKPPDSKRPMKQTTAIILAIAVAFPLFRQTASAAQNVDTAAALIAAVRDGAEGMAIHIAPGVYEIDAPLEPKAGMTLTGAGMDKTIITHVAGWKPSTATLPDPEMKTQGMDTRAYLLRLKDKAAGITVSDMTLRGPQLHGAVFGSENRDLHLHHLRIQETLWTGIRTFSMKGARIHDCEFIVAGGRWDHGARKHAPKKSK